MAFAEYFAGYFHDFGEDVVLAGATVRAIFDNGYANAFDVVAGSVPKLTLAEADLGAAVRDSAVTVRGIAYTIADIQKDGTGMATLLLEASA